MNEAWYDNFIRMRPLGTMYRPGDRFYTELSDLVKKHYDFTNYSKSFATPWEFTIYNRKMGDRFRKSIGIRLTNGEFGNVSVKSCLSPPTKNTLLKNALRSEVQADIDKIRATITQEFACPLCGGVAVKFHIDHYPVSFQTLVERFGISPDEEISKDPATNYWLLTNRTLASRWKEYHTANATLRPICATCNLRGGQWDTRTNPVEKLTHCILFDE